MSNINYPYRTLVMVNGDCAHLIPKGPWQALPSGVFFRNEDGALVPVSSVLVALPEVSSVLVALPEEF